MGGGVAGGLGERPAAVAARIVSPVGWTTSASQPSPETSVPSSCKAALDLRVVSFVVVDLVTAVFVPSVVCCRQRRRRRRRFLFPRRSVALAQLFHRFTAPQIRFGNYQKRVAFRIDRRTDAQTDARNWLPCTTQTAPTTLTGVSGVMWGAARVAKNRTAAP